MNIRISMASTKEQEKSQANFKPKRYSIFNTKRDKLIDIWVRPLSTLNLKIWIHDANDGHGKPSIAIGLGLKEKTEISPEMFSFAVLDEDSVDWFINVIKESTVIRNKPINKSLPDSIIWKRHRILDGLRKISITVIVKKKGDNLMTIMMVNSKTFLYSVLDDSDIEWIFSRLEVAKYKL